MISLLPLLGTADPVLLPGTAGHVPVAHVPIGSPTEGMMLVDFPNAQARARDTLLRVWQREARVAARIGQWAMWRPGDPMVIDSVNPTQALLVDSKTTNSLIITPFALRGLNLHRTLAEAYLMAKPPHLTPVVLAAALFGLETP